MLPPQMSPLMANANETLVTQAAQMVVRDAPPAQQAALLVILGVFGEPFVPAAQFVRLVGKEHLMGSDLVSYLMEEQVAEREARYTEELQRTLEATIAARFPAAPLRFAQTIHQITRTDVLHRLIIAVVSVADVPAVEQALARALVIRIYPGLLHRPPTSSVARRGGHGRGRYAGHSRFPSRDHARPL